MCDQASGAAGRTLAIPELVRAVVEQSVMASSDNQLLQFRAVNRVWRNGSDKEPVRKVILQPYAIMGCYGQLSLSCVLECRPELYERVKIITVYFGPLDSPDKPRKNSPSSGPIFSMRKSFLACAAAKRMNFGNYYALYRRRSEALLENVRFLTVSDLALQVKHFRNNTSTLLAFPDLVSLTLPFVTEKSHCTVG